MSLNFDSTSSWELLSMSISLSVSISEPDLYAHAQTVDTRRSSPIFQAPGYEATTEGKRHLGAAIGTPQFISVYIC